MSSLWDKSGYYAERVKLVKTYIASRALITMFPFWSKLGLHVMRNHYYSPTPDTTALTDAIYDRRSELLGLSLDLDSQAAWIERVYSLYGGEFSKFPLKRTRDRLGFYLENGSFGSADADVYWYKLRDSRPRRVIEVGSGNSTLLAAQAAMLNADEGSPLKYTVIDPYPRDSIRRLIRDTGNMNLIRERVQDVDVSLFDELGKNDILFIDSSHVVAMNSDVTFEVLDVLPRLGVGVNVHFHDIMLPLEYPREWIKHLYFWNEQYLVQAFLSGNPDYEVTWAGRMMSMDRADALKSAIPSFDPSRTRPGSFWIRRRER